MSNQMQRPWGDLPHDISIQVLEMLFGKDIISFRSVCKHWRRTPAPQVKRINHPVSEIVKHPLLLSFRRKSCKNVASSSSCYARLYSPAYNKTYLVDSLLPSIANAQIHCYNYGWLLMSHESGVNFFLHPTTQSIIDLPHSSSWDRWSLYDRMSFSAPPTSPDCVVFGLVDRQDTGVYISIIRRGDDEWTKYELSNKMITKKKSSNHHRRLPTPCKLKTSFNASNFRTPPVFYNGEFYSLGTAGRLGVFNPDKKLKWRVLDTVHASFPASTDSLCETYLTKSTNGPLISIIVRSKGESNAIKVMRFNESLEKWHDVTFLKDEAIFLSRPSCMVINCRELGVKGLENTIHFPRFDDDQHYCNVFYSISSKRFHTFGGAVKDDLCDTKLPINCAWIVPHDFQSFNDQQLNWSSLLVEAVRITEEGDCCMTTVEKLSFLQTTIEASQCKKMIISQQDTSSRGKPWIIIFPHQIQDKQKTVYVDLTNETEQYYYSSETMSIDRRVFLMSDERLRGKDVMASKDGRVFLMDVDQGICMLVDTSSMTIHQLPMWNNVPDEFDRTCCLLHNLSPDQDSKISVIIFGRVWNDADDSFAFLCTIGDERWTKLEGDRGMHTVVSHEGKIYGMTCDPVFVDIKIQPNSYKSTELFELPFYGRIGCLNMIDKFVESCGEILYFNLWFVGYKGGNDIIADIKVYKLDVKMARLEELQDFGDRAFFLSDDLDCAYGCIASTFGLKANTIYYTNASSNKLYEYDYGHGIVTYSVYCSNIEEAHYRNKFFMYC